MKPISFHPARLLVLLVLAGALAGCDRSDPTPQNTFTGDQRLLGVWESDEEEDRDWFLVEHDAATRASQLTFWNLSTVNQCYERVGPVPITSVTPTAFTFRFGTQSQTVQYAFPSADRLTITDGAVSYAYHRTARTAASFTPICP